MITTAQNIAAKFNVLESAIVRIEEWASVMFCVVKGIGARFVSKKLKTEDKPMSILTAAVMASELNKRFNTEINENLFHATIRTPRGRLIAEAEGETPLQIIEEATQVAIESGYKQEYIKVEIVPSFQVKLDWRALPWIKPVNQESDWTEISEWMKLAIAQSLDPQLHVIAAKTEYETSRVSLKLWNLRVSQCE